jgi:hypothetical protein
VGQALPRDRGSLAAGMAARHPDLCLRPGDPENDLIYTTNAVEALNRSLRKIIKTRGSFPNDEATILLYLALRNAGIHWRRPIAWTAAMGQFAIQFRRALCRLSGLPPWGQSADPANPLTEASYTKLLTLLGIDRDALEVLAAQRAGLVRHPVGSRPEAAPASRQCACGNG